MEKMLARWEAFIEALSVVLVLSLTVVAGCFYAMLFARFNKAPELTRSFEMGEEIHSPYKLSIDSCRSSVSKISVSGWIARPGLHRNRHETVVALKDLDTGRLFKMRTSIQNRKDVTASLNHELGDKINYDNSGFSASLNVAFSHPEIRRAQLYAIFDPGNGGGSRSVWLPCNFSAAP